ncbi:MAG: N-formylglutamate amidohydrolase [Pararhodobacter sp.]
MPAAQPEVLFPHLPRFAGLVERWTARGTPGTAPATPGAILICEHASNALPVDWPELGGDLGISAQTRASHAAWDIGALGVARGLAPEIATACGGAVLVHAPLSRLVYDLNRAPDHPGAMPETSEIHPIPGNRNLTDAQKLARIVAVRQPFHTTLSDVVMETVALGRRPVLIAVHSFTPVYMGQARAVEFGVLSDDDDALAFAILRAAEGCGLECAYNEPYSAKGDVAHTTRMHAGPLRLRNTMLEIRNDLITGADQQEEMAARLAPVLIEALDACDLTNRQR